MTIDQWLTKAVQRLVAHNSGTSRLDALVMLEDSLQTDRANLLAHTDKPLDAKQLKQLDGWLKRRLQHEPLAYIRGRTEFYGREFVINQHVLEPRPESETMIEQLKQLKLDRPSILDVGTGSGAIGITAALELPDSTVSLLDIDQAALEVAKTNLAKHNLKLTVLKNDLLAGLTENYDVLLCNLPYVPDNFQVNEAAMREPRIAIFGGPDGLDLYRRLFAQAAAIQPAPTYILTESLPTQHDALAVVAAQSGYHQKVEDDFIQVFQVAQATL